MDIKAVKHYYYILKGRHNKHIPLRFTLAVEIRDGDARYGLAIPNIAKGDKFVRRIGYNIALCRAMSKKPTFVRSPVSSNLEKKNVIYMLDEMSLDILYNISKYRKLLHDLYHDLYGKKFRSPKLLLLEPEDKEMVWTNTKNYLNSPTTSPAPVRNRQQ